MIRFLGQAFAFVLCGNTTETEEHRLARIERPYAKCIFSRAAKFGSPKRVTETQAKRVAASCSNVLNAVLEDGRRNGVFKPQEECPSGSCPWPSEYEYWAINLENSYMRKISQAVLPLPPI